MKFTVSREQLRNNLSDLVSIISPQVALPVLKNVLLRAENGKLEITATDLDMSLISSLDISMDKSGLTSIPGKTFYDLVRELDDDTVSIEVLDRKTIIKSGKNESKINCEDENDFPELPEITPLYTFFIEADRLHRKIIKTMFAVSRDETRPNLMGALLEISDGMSTMVSSDSHRLVKISSILERESEAQNKNLDEDINVIIPLKTLSILSRLLSSTIGQVEIRLGESYFTAIIGPHKLHSKIIDSKFPNYKRVIPSESVFTVKIKKTECLSILKRLSVLAPSNSHQVYLDFFQDRIEFRVESVEVGTSWESMEVSYSGENITTTYNINYLIDCLKNIDGDVAVFKYTNPDSAVVIEPEIQRENENLLFLLMPLIQK